MWDVVPGVFGHQPLEEGMQVGPGARGRRSRRRPTRRWCAGGIPSPWPVVMPLAWTTRATWSVISYVPLPRVATVNVSACALMRPGTSRPRRTAGNPPHGFFVGSTACTCYNTPCMDSRDPLLTTLREDVRFPRVPGRSGTGGPRAARRTLGPGDLSHRRGQIVVLPARGAAPAGVDGGGPRR